MNNQSSHNDLAASGLFMRFFASLQNHRRLTLLLLVLLTLTAIPGLQQLQIDTGFSSMIPERDPHLQIYKQITAEFGSDNKAMVFIKDPQLWSNDKLQDLLNLHNELSRLNGVRQVESLASLRSVSGQANTLRSISLVPDLPATDKQIQQSKSQALKNPLVIDHFIAADGLATILLITYEQQAFNNDELLNRQLNQVLNNYQQRFEKLFQLAAFRLNSELKSALVDDLSLLGPLSIGVLLITLLLFLRHLSAAMIPVITSILSLIWALGMMGWLSIPLNILIAMLPSIVIVISSTEDSHMIIAYLRGLDSGIDSRQPRKQAVNFMLRHIGVPTLLTILTTALGFASNMFSNLAMIRDFAIASTIAILANGIITLLLVPMLLQWFGPLKNAIKHQELDGRGLSHWTYRLFLQTNKRWSLQVLAVTTLLCGFFIYQASSLFVTNDPLSYFRSDRALLKDVQTLHQEMAGMKSFFISLQSDQEKAFQQPRNLQRLLDIQNFMKTQAVFDNSISLADFLSLINREFYQGNDNAYRLPRSVEQTAQFLLFFHRNELAPYISHDFQRANIIVRHNITDSFTLNKHINELQNFVDNIAGKDMRGYVVGENLMINKAAETLMLGQITSLAILLLVIFVIISVMFTSIKGGLIALIPGIVPISLMFGVMGMFDIPLNPGTSLVAVIAIGIAVDGSIHLFSRYNETSRHAGNNDLAVQQTVRQEAIPLVATSLSLALGFGVLLFSNFTLIAQFGAMAAMTMLFAIYSNLLITPLIMSKIRLVGLYDILLMNISREHLERSPLFKDMSHYQIRKAILISDYQQIEDQTTIIHQGSTERSMYLLLEGKVQIVRNKTCLATLKTGDIFGEIGFVRETLRTADVIAAGPVKLLRFDHDRLKKDLRYFPNIVAKLNFNISVILGERLAELIEQHNKSLTDSDNIHG